MVSHWSWHRSVFLSSIVIVRQRGSWVTLRGRLGGLLNIIKLNKYERRLNAKTQSRIWPVHADIVVGKISWNLVADAVIVGTRVCTMPMTGNITVAWVLCRFCGLGLWLKTIIKVLAAAGTHEKEWGGAFGRRVSWWGGEKRPKRKMHSQNTILRMPISEEELFFDWALLGYTSRRPGWNNSLIEEWGGVTNINFYGIGM